MLTSGRRRARMSKLIFALPLLGALFATHASGNELSGRGLESSRFAPISAVPRSRLPANSLKVALLEWIGANSGYDVSGEVADPPRVKFCKHGSTLIYEGKAIHFDDRLNGVYDATTRQICLAEPWDARNVKDAGVLLHELAHYVQFRQGRWTCPRKAEWEAYKLQEAWLIENGQEPDFNWLSILLASRCTPRDVHP